MNAKQIVTIGIGIVSGAGITAMLLTKSLASQNINISSNLSINQINADEAKKIMLERVQAGNITKFGYDSNDINPKYKGTLIKDNIEYDIEVNAKTGEIMQFNEEDIAIDNTNTKNNATQPTTTQNDTTVQNNATQTASTQNNNTTQNNATQRETAQQLATSQSYNSNIGEQKARDIMLSKVPSATFKSFYFDAEDNEYEGELVKGNFEYDVDVNANTGDVVKFEKDLEIFPQTPTTQSTNPNIGAQKAKNIMLSKVPSATFKSFYFDAEDNAYEGELIKGNFEYDVDVNARTGAVIKFEKDYLDIYDN